MPIILPLLLISAALVLGLSFENFKKDREAGGCGCDFETATGEFDPSEKEAFFQGKSLLAPQSAFVEAWSEVLGEALAEQKWIEIDLSEQKLYAWEGEKKFLETLISSGTWNRTPTGDFQIWGKFKYTKMSGGSKEDGSYYYLPNVPYTMYFYKGFGVHGTYWHNNFGTPMSHGCINLPTLAAEKLFYWSTPVLPLAKNYVRASQDNPGTRVVIHD